MQQEPGGLPPATMLLDVGNEWGEHGRRLRFLRRVELFHQVPRELLTSIAIAMKPQPAVAGSAICREGEAADQFYLIEAGTLVVSVEIAGQSHEVARLGPGQYFGEIALLEAGRRTATVRAETAAQLWTLSGADFRDLLEREPTLDAAIRRTARAREVASGRSVFEVENRNLAALAESKAQITIGRSPDNDLTFASRLVSRHHAVLERVDNGFRLRDLDTANGTFVNGARIHWADLTDGSEIRVGDERIVFDRREIRRCIEPRGMRVDVVNVNKEVKGGKRLLNGISLSILPGEMVAIVGGSGAGKTTLMDAISGVRRATDGQILYNGRDYYQNIADYRTSLGYVPQDDIIHKDLPVQRTLWYAGKLRLPPDTGADELKGVVDEVMQNLGLSAQADLRVGSLSGGQRKRASIGVELLTQPRIFFLDEPTSGLDPATDTQMMRLLRRLADEGSTVVLTTHATKNVAMCDKIVFLARGGYLGFAGTPRRALQYFEAEAFDEIYERLSEEATPQEWAQRFRDSEDYTQLIADQPQAAVSAAPAAMRSAKPPGAGLAGLVRQWALLSRRNFDILVKNPPNLIPLFITPVIISVLLVTLFRSGAFSLNVSNPLTPAQILFFLGFGSFFFGVNYALEEICKEFPIFYRERLVNLAIVPYVMSKVVVLMPVLAFVVVFMLGILRLADRLPNKGLELYASLWLTLVLTEFAGLAIGLAASAAVKSTQQATIVSPGLIMPQVLFSGAILPVPAMAVVGRFLSRFMAIRWSYEALGHIADLNYLFANARSPLGRPILEQYGNSFSRRVIENWGILGLMVVIFLALSCLILKRKSAT